MNEVKRINLNRSQFVIAQDAYKDLETYLNDVKKHSESDEVINEIEARMAELLIENRGLVNDKVVLKDDIEFLKSQLGRPVDFDDEVVEKPASGRKSDSNRKLMRNPEGQIIGGVASGLGTYFETDPLWFRLIFIALVLASGFGIILYIAMWILIPQARTESDKLEMQGLPVTVENIKDRIESLDIQDKTTQASRAFSKVASLIIKVAVGLLAYSLLTFSVALLLTIFTAASYLYFSNLKLNGVDIFPLTLVEKFGFGFIVLALLLFFAGLIMVSLRIIHKKRFLSASSANWLGVLTVFSFCLGVAMVGSSAPKLEDRYRSSYSSESRTLKPFNTINVSGRLNLKGYGYAYNQRSDSSFTNVKILTHKNIDISKIRTIVDENGVLTVDTTAVDTSEDNCPEICTIPFPIIEVVN